MASRAKNKTTMAKLNRENRLREAKAEKAARKTARRIQLETGGGFSHNTDTIWPADPDQDSTAETSAA